MSRPDRAGKNLPAAAFFAGIESGSTAADVMAAAAGTDVNSYERLQQLLRLPGVMPDFAGKHGITPLMAACAAGNAWGAELLASHPLVSLSRADSDGRTALHYAAANGNADCVRALLSHQAPPGATTKAGETPFDLAQDEKTKDAFWESRYFVRHMKLHQPEHEKLQPPPQAPAPAPAPEVPPAPKAQPDPLKDAFFHALTNVGLQWKADPRMDIRGALMDKMAVMNVDDFAPAYKILREACDVLQKEGAEFDWSRMFVKAAAADNLPVMRFLHDEILFDQHALNQALSAVVERGDRRDAAHHLAIWGANPGARHEVDGRLEAPSIFDAAVRNKCAGVFEELVLWRPGELAKSDVERYRGMPAQGSTQGNLRQALALHAKRLEFKKLRGQKLKAAFNAAVALGDINGVMAGYAEARHDRFLRGNAEVSKAAGGGAIAIALRHEKYEFARLLIAEGFHLKDAPQNLRTELQVAGTAKAKQFAEDHLSGKMKVVSVPDVGRKRRSEIHILTHGFRPGHYGMF